MRMTSGDEASLWSVGFRSGDQVFRAIEISPPDIILVLSPENRGKMNDRRNTLDGMLQRIRIEKIAFHGDRSGGNFLARPYTPASTNRRKSREPTSPVPPVTKIVMLDFLLP